MLIQFSSSFIYIFFIYFYKKKTTFYEHCLTAAALLASPLAHSNFRLFIHLLFFLTFIISLSALYVFLLLLFFYRNEYFSFSAGAQISPHLFFSQTTRGRAKIIPSFSLSLFLLFSPSRFLASFCLSPSLRFLYSFASDSYN